MATIDLLPWKKTWSCTRQGNPLKHLLRKKRIIFIGALAYMLIFVVMFEIYMLCVSSDISHHVYYILYYTMLGFLALLEFENKLSIYIIIHSGWSLAWIFMKETVNARGPCPSHIFLLSVSQVQKKWACSSWHMFEVTCNYLMRGNCYLNLTMPAALAYFFRIHFRTQRAKVS